MCLQCLSTYHMRTWSVFQVYKFIITTHQCVYNVCQLITWQHELCVSRFATLYSQSINVFTMFVNLSYENMKCVPSLQIYNHNPSMCLQCLSTYHLTTWRVCYKVYNFIITTHQCVYNVCQLIIWEHEVCSKFTNL